MTQTTAKENRIFKAKLRILIDLLLLLNCALFVFLSAEKAPLASVPVTMIGASIILILFWYFVAGPLARIEISQGNISGRSGNFKKVSFPLRKVNHVKTMKPLSPVKKFFFKDIIAIDGQSIRLHRRIIGQDQVRKIMIIIQDYPFKESPLPKEEHDPGPGY